MKQRIRLTFDGDDKSSETLLSILATHLQKELFITTEKTTVNAYGDEIHTLFVVADD